MLTAEQKAMRKTGIGGSEIAAIFGESRFAAPFDVWLAKTQGWEQPETEDMLRGSFLEDGIARWYAHRFGIDEAKLQHCDTLRHRVHEWAFCTSDRLVSGATGRERILSIKAPRRGGDDWGQPGSDKVPGEYLLQLQWEWAIHASHGLQLDEEMHLAAIVDGELAVYPVQADRELQAWLLEDAGKWWQRFVVGGETPALDGSSQAREWLKRRFARDDGERLQATPHLSRLMLELELAEREADRWAGEVEALQNEIKLSMGAATYLVGANGIISWKANVKGVRSFKPKWTKEK